MSNARFMMRSSKSLDKTEKGASFPGFGASADAGATEATVEGRIA